MAARFRSRVDGFMRRRPHWRCRGCRIVFRDQKPVREARPDEKGPYIKRKDKPRMVMACTNCGGRDFDYWPSRLEYDRYIELEMLQKGGHIRDLEQQPRFDLTINGQKFRVSMDARYIDQETGQEVVEDVKTEATNTGLSQIKRALVAEQYGVEALLTKPSRRR